MNNRKHIDRYIRRIEMFVRRVVYAMFSCQSFHYTHTHTTGHLYKDTTW